jgi:hypothetical protein
MTMHEAAEVLEVTRAMHQIATTPHGATLTRQEIAREAEAMIAAMRESSRSASQGVDGD